MKHYKLPLEIDDFVDNIVWTRDHVRAFDFTEDEFNSVEKREIIKVINGEILYPYKKQEFYYKDGEIFKKKQPHPVITIRGWGYLIGLKKLSNQEAIDEQDEFGKFIVDQLNKKS